MNLRSKRKERIMLGDRVKDRVTGFEGIVTTKIRFLAGCVRVGVSAEKLKPDGEVMDSQTFDEPDLVVTKENVHKPVTAKPNSIKLGDRVEHTISGFTGIVNGEAFHLSQPRTLHIAPERTKKDGDLAQVIIFDERAVKRVKPVLKKAKKETGGPRALPDITH